MKKCDFYVIVCVTFFAIVCNVLLFRFCFESESTVISNFWKQIVVRIANVVNNFPVILGAPYNRVFRWNFDFAYFSQSSSKV